MKTKPNKQRTVPPLIRVMLNPSSKYYQLCSEETHRSMHELSKALLFTIIFCGTLLAASICQNCFSSRLQYFLPILVICGWLYYLIDKPIVFASERPGQFFVRKWRVAIAIILAGFNSLLIDSYYFGKDIVAARNGKIEFAKNRARDLYSAKDDLLDKDKPALYQSIDNLNRQLSDARQALNDEADGSSHTGQIGTGKIWRTKRATYLADSADKASQIDIKKGYIKRIDSLHNINNELLQTEINQIPSQFSEGMSKNMELLHEVVWSSGNLTSITMFILFILIAMIPEIVPLLSKKFYDVSEYFERAAQQKGVKEHDAMLEQTKEIQLLGDKHTLSLLYEQSQIKKEHHINQLLTEIEHNQNIDQHLSVELDRLQILDDNYKRNFPRFYDSHFKAMILESYEKLFKAINAART